MTSISIVTPSFNQGQFIARTIDSVLQQEHGDLDFIVCDGGSTDGTLSVLERYAQHMRFVSEPDRGQADAVNKGIQATRGEIIGWLNSDDLYRPGAFAAVAEAFAAQPAIDVVYGRAELIDEHERAIGDYYTEPWDRRRLIDRCFLCQPAVFFRRRVVERFGLLDKRLHYTLDYEYWLRLAAGGARFLYMPRVLAASRLHADAKTLRARLAIHAEINEMLRSKIGYVPASWLVNHAHTLVELDRDGATRRRPMPYALAVVLHAYRLAFEWNHGLSADLLRQTLGPIAKGARRRAVQTVGRR